MKENLDKHTIELHPSGRAEDPEWDKFRDDGTHEIWPDLSYKRLGIVNVVFYGARDCGDRDWVLIDTGLPRMARLVLEAADERFGHSSRPGVIIMTHGHFDHAGNLVELSDHWDTPVYCHMDELPYLIGQRSYPAPDPSVGGGIMPLVSPLFPDGPVDVSHRARALPLNGMVPGMPGWRWIHTPGHTPGHVSLWRESDRTLIVGDAFLTTSMESAYSVVTQAAELHGPPMMMTPDWKTAHISVRHLAELEPEVVICGHGRPMRGPEMREALKVLALDFERLAVPANRRYVW